MKSTGIIRRIDDLGRVVIPKEIRKNLNIKENDSLEIFIDGENIILKKYSNLSKVEKLFNKYINIYTPSLKTYIIFWNLVFPLRYIYHCFKRIIKKLFIWKKK